MIDPKGKKTCTNIQRWRTSLSPLQEHVGVDLGMVQGKQSSPKSLGKEEPRKQGDYLAEFSKQGKKFM